MIAGKISGLGKGKLLKAADDPLGRSSGVSPNRKTVSVGVSDQSHFGNGLVSRLSSLFHFVYH